MYSAKPLPLIIATKHLFIAFKTEFIEKGKIIFYFAPRTGTDEKCSKTTDH